MVEHSSSTETPHHEPRLSRQLGLTTATALVVAEVIGVGIFLTTAGMVKSLGSPFWLLPVWLTTGVAAAGGAICFGALAARRPEAGGAYVYLWVAQLPFLTLLLLPALFPRLFPNVPRPGPDDDLGAVPGRARRLGRGVFLGVLLVKFALYLGDRLSPYSDPFADAIGMAAREALPLARRGLALVLGVLEAGLVAGERLVGMARGPAGAGGAVADRWNKLVAWVPPPLAEVWSLVNALWGWLVGRPGAGERSRTVGTSSWPGPRRRRPWGRGGPPPIPPPAGRRRRGACSRSWSS